MNYGCSKNPECGVCGSLKNSGWLIGFFILTIAAFCSMLSLKGSNHWINQGLPANLFAGTIVSLQFLCLTLHLSKNQARLVKKIVGVTDLLHSDWKLERQRNSFLRVLEHEAYCNFVAPDYVGKHRSNQLGLKYQLAPQLDENRDPITFHQLKVVTSTS